MYDSVFKTEKLCKTYFSAKKKGLVTRNANVLSHVIQKLGGRTKFQIDRQTDRTKHICTPIFDMGALK